MIILPANTLSTGGYEVANSCRFNDNDTAYMHKTPSSSGSQRTFTFSTWWKQGDLASSSVIFSSGESDGDPNFAIYFTSAQQLNVLYYEGSSLLQLVTNAKYRDPAWLHICVAIDTTQSTNTDRAKIYINGSQVTSLGTATYCNQNVDISINTSSYRMAIGAGVDNGDVADGYAAETVFIDGSALAPTSFGEFDEDSPTIWKPKDVSGLTFGTNGFYLDFEDSSNLGNDKNGGTDLTEVNLAATDQATDTPTNNFCTMNPLNAYYDVCTLSEGNTKYDGNSAVGQYTFTPATMGFSKGKWYWEMKFGSSDTDNWGGIGITSANSTGTTNYLGGSANAYAYYGRTLSGGLGVTYTNNTQTNQGLPFEDGDIIMVAVDCDNLAIYFGKNGTWLNNSSSVTGVPTSGSSKTGAFFSITAPSSTTDGFYFPASGTYSGSQVYPQFLNFGSPAYAISSGNADGNGYGNFEYSVPSGYYSLCTKNLAEFG